MTDEKTWRNRIKNTNNPIMKNLPEIPNPQPQKEYIIISMDEINRIGINHIFPAIVPKFIQDIKDASRPAPSPQPIDDAIPFSDWLSIHNTAIRNATIDEAIKAFDKEDSDGFANMVRAKHIVNSLRTQEQP